MTTFFLNSLQAITETELLRCLKTTLLRLNLISGTRQAQLVLFQNYKSWSCPMWGYNTFASLIGTPRLNAKVTDGVIELLRALLCLKKVFPIGVNRMVVSSEHCTLITIFKLWATLKQLGLNFNARGWPKKKSCTISGWPKNLSPVLSWCQFKCWDCL